MSSIVIVADYSLGSLTWLMFIFSVVRPTTPNITSVSNITTTSAIVTFNEVINVSQYSIQGTITIRLLYLKSQCKKTKEKNSLFVYAKHLNNGWKKQEGEYRKENRKEICNDILNFFLNKIKLLRYIDIL